eukprot:3355104-Prorocentrum_lima.AAC.1
MDAGESRSELDRLFCKNEQVGSKPTKSSNKKGVSMPQRNSNPNAKCSKVVECNRPWRPDCLQSRITRRSN